MWAIGQEGTSLIYSCSSPYPSVFSRAGDQYSFAGDPYSSGCHVPVQTDNVVRRRKNRKNKNKL